ncbi:hypothetical protein WK33_22380 [Burkholderia multivorans]|nr:hypothetical protein WK33_22380 [Burkholderia multivorans]
MVRFPVVGDGEHSKSDASCKLRMSGRLDICRISIIIAHHVTIVCRVMFAHDGDDVDTATHRGAMP